MENNINDILYFLEVNNGFNYRAYHYEMLERRIFNRIVNTKAENAHNYYKRLTTDPEEPDRLIENFMINVSHFFRDPLCFEVLAKIIIPDLITAKQNRNDNSFRIWSAGCSHGEEAYSLAILLNEYFKREKIRLNIDFFATDFDATVIENAKRGEYPAESIKEVKHGFIEDYFKITDSVFKVQPVLKSMIRFSVYDLLDKHSYAPSESVFGDFDLVLCRNVLIYFNPGFQELIFSKLFKSLASKGILMLGETEAPVTHFKDKFRQISRHCKIFEKK
ncbi:MAG: protein-glutamate O-methyltransferase CheR [Bacteroidota bacterium]